MDVVGARVVKPGQAEMPCPVHGGDNPRGFAIGVGKAKRILLACRTQCDMTEEDWHSRAVAALLAKGASRDMLRVSATSPVESSEASDDLLPPERQLDAWTEYLWREPRLRRAVRRRWRISDTTVAAADLGWDPVRDLLTMPVYDPDSHELRTVIYRDLRDPLPPGMPKSRVQKGTRGSHLYAPFGIRPAERVVLCAGERDVLAAHEAALNAVSFTGGEGAVPETDRLEPLRGRDLVIVYDVDAKGVQASQKVAAKLADVAAAVSVADLSVLELPAKGDLSDALSDHGTKAVDRVLRDAVRVEHDTTPPEGPQPVDWQEFWLEDPEPIRYLVEPLVAVGEITRLYAQAKVGKSLLIQECAAAIALGRKVMGETPEVASVLYIDQENTWDDWKTRLADMGYGPDDDWSRLSWYSLQAWPALDSSSGGALLVERVQHHDARLVVIDTQSKLLDGEEDKAPTSAAFYRHSLLPLKRLGVAVVIIDHAGNDPSKPRGSSGKRDDVDVVWQVTPTGLDALTLTRTHSRKRHAVDRLRVHRVLNPLRHEVGDGDSEPSHIERCVDAICALQPIPSYDTSARQVGILLREAGVHGGKGFRDATVRAAWKVVRGE